MWIQSYDPLNNELFSFLAALAPLAVLLGCLALLRLKAHWSAILGLASACLVALAIYKIPAPAALASGIYGIAYGLLPIGWIVLNVLFLFNLAGRRGLVKTLQEILGWITPDRRLQALAVAFCLGAFFEGAAGFSTPVAVVTVILAGAGFPPLMAGILALVANTAPVPFAGLGTPLVALQGVTGLDLGALTAQVALQLAVFDLLIPFWITVILAGWASAWEVLPAVLVTGGVFAAAQLAVAVLHGPWLVNIIASLLSLAALVLFLRVWKPSRVWMFPHETNYPAAQAGVDWKSKEYAQAVLPWLVLTLVVFVWGIPTVKSMLDGISTLKIPVPGLHLLVQRAAPLVSTATPEKAIFELNLLSASGTGILIAGLISGLLLRFNLRQMASAYWETLKQARFTLVTIACTMALGFVCRYAGMDGTLGLAFARSGALYPFFGTLLGWLGVVLTGSDTSSNVLFGSLQRITAGQLGIDPVTMAAANSTGGVMGKMINAQSISVAATAAGLEGREGEILRRVFWNSLALAGLAGLVVMAFVYLGV